MAQDDAGRIGIPGPALRGLVGYHGYDIAGVPAGRHRGLPSPYLTLVVSLDEPLTMGRPDGTVVRHDTVLGGLHVEPVDVLHDGRQAGVHVTLHPLAARALLGLPAGALSAADLDARFRAEFGVTPKVAARVARFDRARRVIAGRALAGVPLALARVAADGGFADQSHLVREFRSLAGLAPTRWLAEEVGYLHDAPGPSTPSSAT